MDFLIGNIILFLMFMIGMSEGIATRRASCLLATAIIALFAGTTATLPVTNLTAIMVSALGMTIGAIYFYESFTGKGLVMVYDVLKKWHSSNQPHTKAR